MKIEIGALLAVTLVLAGCEAPPKAADAGDKPAVATSDQAAPKRKCAASTGSRMGSCDATPDVTGSSGDDYRQSTFGRATQSSAPF